MSDYLLSLVRTFVPTAVGAVLGWLATIGLELGAEAEAGLVVFLTAACIAVYYALVRALESKWPSLGRLLGATGKPTYEPAVVATIRQRADQW